MQIKVQLQLGFNPFLLINSVLIDPHKRAIYDALGTEGLIQNDLQLVVRSKSPQEIREEYERLSKQKEELLRQKMTNTHVIGLKFSWILSRVNLFLTFFCFVIL